MVPSWPSGPTGRVDLGLAAGIACIALAVYLASPVRQIADSNFSMLLSESVLREHSFALERYLPGYRGEPVPLPHAGLRTWQLLTRSGHVYYLYPAGGSILSIPFVAVMNAAGRDAIATDGTFDPIGEAAIQNLLAPLLTAVFAAFVYLLARSLLPRASSVLVALGGAFGTQAWSSASRAMWSHTWTLLLLTLALCHLVWVETGRSRLRPILLGSLLAWAYLTRPTASLAVLAVTLWMVLTHRRQLPLYALAGAAWMGLFGWYSYAHYGGFLPPYYLASKAFRFENVPAGLAGHLFSPSRGLLVYVPSVLFVLFLVVRYRRTLPLPGLCAVALAVIAAHVVVVSSWAMWWGGSSYGPRLLTCLVPWFALLAAAGLRARMDAAGPTPVNRTAENCVGMALLLASIVVNGIGAVSQPTWTWNDRLGTQARDRLWDWRHAQVVAAFDWPWPDEPSDYQPGARILAQAADAERHLRAGWGPLKGQARWTLGPRAEIAFTLTQPNVSRLRMLVQPFLVADKLKRQRVEVFLNGQPIGRILLRKPTPRIFELALPPELLQTENVLVLELPDAKSPVEMGVGPDPFPWGMALWWVEFQ